MNRWQGILAIVLLVCLGQAGQAYDFWGITLGSAIYDGSDQLTFDGVAESGADYAVGGYKYTRVDNTWLGAFEAASPGAGFMASRISDAQGLFFRADDYAARFMIITGSKQTGAAAPECGTGTRLFGPGDLKIDVDGRTYGIGMRLSDLRWALDPSTTNPEFLIHGAEGGIESIFARDKGTLGTVELGPNWAHMGNAILPDSTDLAYAFFISGTGSQVGSANVSFANTGIVVGGAGVYAYEITVPWATLGLDRRSYEFRASWRPDCGNDVIAANFSSGNFQPVPEPASIAALLSGLLTTAAFRKRG